MWLTGLTLEAQGLVRSAEAPSLVMLEIQLSSLGMTEGMEKDLTSGGPLATSSMGWIGDRLYLPLHRKNVEFGFQRASWCAAHAEDHVRRIATALGWEL